MKKTIPLFILLSLNLHAVTLDITGPCSKTPIVSIEASSRFETIGDLTMHYLKKNNIPFQGNERAINSIFNTPLGLDALEVISDTEMRSYGWCFKVNGKLPDRFADEINVGEGDHIEWFFAYAWYDKGWDSMCNPAYLIKSPLFCKK